MRLIHRKGGRSEGFFSNPVSSSVLPIFLCTVFACGGEASKPSQTPRERPFAAIGGQAKAEADVLGPRPTVADPAAYTPPVPVSYKRESGMTVWLLERHGLPVVSMQIVVPAGAAYDPEGKGGLAMTTANMLDEGAGKRGPLDLSRDIDRLGATLATGAYADYAFAQLTVLKKNLAPAAAIFGDVVSKPQLSPVEFKRVHDLWENALKARQSEPEAVAGVVVTRKVYPAGHPYAHPTDGVLSTASKVTLDDVKKFYGARWRPDRATCVVVGDVTKAEVDTILDQALGSWKAGTTSAPEILPSGKPQGSPEPKPAGRKVVVVDRADAPQSVIAVARQAVSAFEEDAAVLPRLNIALGGSFTSRLNQDLREEHGWSYGAHSRFSFNRMRGVFVAQAAVHTEHTGEALKAMLADIESMAKDGLTDEEVDKTKKVVRAELVETFETVKSTAARFGRNAGIGLPPDREPAAANAAAVAGKPQLQRLSSTYLDASGATIVVVGPRAQIEPQLKAIGLTTIESSGPEGQ
jgi:predicted Zn-dependent peptidase